MTTPTIRPPPDEDMRLRPIAWIPDRPPRLVPGKVQFLDQTRLPLETRFMVTADPETLHEAIRNLRVRGAPAIGITAAMALVAAIQHLDLPTLELLQLLNRTADRLADARPTAVNLFQALDRMLAVAEKSVSLTPDCFKEAMAAEAAAIRDEDAAMCRAIGHWGSALLRGGTVFLTHCNAGALATAEYGTALAPLYNLQSEGFGLHVYVDETRPLLQGARLTAWELQKAGIACTVICDGAAAHLMSRRRIDAVLVGADRIAANGDTANKIGTYGLALAAQTHGVPFYVCAPSTTIDLQCADGNAIPIEERDPAEITAGFGCPTAPPDVPAYNPAFDVTPARYIAGIITEHGVSRPDYGASIAKLPAHSNARPKRHFTD